MRNDFSSCCSSCVSRAKLVYVTSQTILPSIIDYYLDLLPGVIPSHARKRLFLVSPMDGSARPLTQKLLERPRLIERIRSLISTSTALISFPSTPPIWKKSWRFAFEYRCMAPIPNFWRWAPRLAVATSSPGRCEASSRLRRACEHWRRDKRNHGNARKPSISQVLVKHNEGVSAREMRSLICGTARTGYCKRTGRY